MITVTNLNFWPIKICLKTFQILHSVPQFIVAKPPEKSYKKMFEFFKTAFFKATHLTNEFQIKDLVLRSILKVGAFFYPCVKTY